MRDSNYELPRNMPVYALSSMCLQRTEESSNGKQEQACVAYSAESELPKNTPTYGLSSVCWPKTANASFAKVDVKSDTNKQDVALAHTYIFPELSPLWRECEVTPYDYRYDRLIIPFATTSISQLISGAFPAVKADMQNNPNLKIGAAFKARYLLGNPEGKLAVGLRNVYRGGAWNYSYVLGCSLTGNNLAQLTRDEAQKYTGSLAAQSLVSGVAAGVTESLWTARLVAGELAKTTGISAPSLRQTYRRVFPSLALRDSIGWVVVQANALYLQEQDKQGSISPVAKVLSFFVSGVIAAAVSAPADANLTRVYRSQTSQTALGVFSEAVKQHGLARTLTAGLRPRVFSVSGPFVAYGVTQYLLNGELDSSVKSPSR